MFEWRPRNWNIESFFVLWLRVESQLNASFRGNDGGVHGFRRLTINYAILHYILQLIKSQFITRLNFLTFLWKLFFYFALVGFEVRFYYKCFTLLHYQCISTRHFIHFLNFLFYKNLFWHFERSIARFC